MVKYAQMGRPPGVSFRFEKNRLLYRGRNTELWDGWIDGQAHLVKRFRVSRPAHWNEFALLSRIKHPVLLKPSYAGFLRDGSFCYGMPLDFMPERNQDFPDLPQFVAMFLSLIQALQAKKIEINWSLEHLIFDKGAERTYIAGVYPLKRIQAQDPVHNLGLLCNFVSHHAGANHELTRVIRKWTRRKEDQLSGCLQDLYSTFPVALERTILAYEWLYSRELELIGGLYRLAEQGKGRLFVIRGDTGDGKSTLMRQIYSDLLLRGGKTIYFLPEKEERAFHSLKKLLRLIHQSCRISTPIPQELNENLIDKYLEKLFSCSRLVTNILIDNFHNCDPFSRRVLHRVFQQVANWKALFVISSDTGWNDGADFAVSISLQKPAFKQIEEAVLVPLWQEKQRKQYFQTIYDRTSGNPLFFSEYVGEAFRTRQNELHWNGNEWSFAQPTVPDFPMALLEFYWNNKPELTEPELALLEVLSLKGDAFEPNEQDGTAVKSLLEKKVLVQADGRYRFCKPLLAEALRKRLEPDRLKSIHKTLAEELSLRAEADSMILLARHYLKAGEPSSALHWACRAAEELGHSIEPSALVLMGELENFAKNLSSAENMLLFRWQADIYRRRGKFQHAAISYRRAGEYAGGNLVLQFQLGLSLAECHILQEDIVSALHALNALDSQLPSIKDEALLFRYYIARGLSSHYRGPRNSEDFQKAFVYAESLADDALLAHGYRRCAWLSLREGQLADASRLARKALRFARLSRDTDEIGHCYKIFASIAWRKSRLDHAEKMMKKSIHAFQKTQNDFGCAGVWNLLGNVYVEKYRFNEAARAFEKAVRLFGGLDHSREVSLAQFNMGLVYLELGKLRQAEKIFLKCRAIDKASGNKWFYAYDLRALAVYCILQGYARKATRLLKRTIEICEELKAEGDILQTNMILLYHYLDQGNYREAQSLVAFLEQRTEQSTEPLTQAEIHHLLAYYYGYLKESEKAHTHLAKSLTLSRRIHHFKLIGKNLILALIFRRTPLRRTDQDFARAVANFKKSKNQLEFADYLLKLYQAYPALAKEKHHLKRIRWMESMYHSLHIKSRYLSVRRLISSGSAGTKDVPYGWWQSLLALMSSPQDLPSKLSAVLKQLSQDMHASYGQLRYLGASGTFDSVRHFDPNVTNSVEELSLKILEQTVRRREVICIDVRMEPELSGHPWVVLNEVGSVLGVPVCREDQFLGLWYFERRKDAPVFSHSDLQKVSFFSTASAPLLEKAIEEASKKQVNAPLAQHRIENVIGSSRAILEVSRLVEKVAPVDISVLIVGESGTGKELIARNIHRMSKRSTGPFVALNCSAIPETLIESELFGHARGAFTGAIVARAGSIEQAHKGTLFLDEIGDLSAAAQAKLLRVIQEREVQRVGETSVRKVDVRFLFATHKNLEKLVKENAYREDLFYRIAGYILTVPPLRDREEDIPVLIKHFTEKFSHEFGKDGIHFSPAAFRLFTDYPWPGNIREMENLIQSLLVNAEPGSTIDIDALPRSIRTTHVHTMAQGMSLEEGRELFDREFVRQALVRNNWNKSRTAKELKITRQGLINLIQRLRLQNA